MRTDPRIRFDRPDDDPPAPDDGNAIRAALAERENEQLRQRNRSLEQALRAASKLFAPYAGRPKR